MTAPVPAPAEAVAPRTETKPPANPLFVKAEHLFEKMEKIYQSISQRAHELFHAGGQKPGSQLDDWFKAEAEFLRLSPVEITEGNGMLNVRIEVPGFKAEELEVSIEPERLMVSGFHETKEEKKKDGEKLIYTEQRSSEIFRDLTLPIRIDPARAKASLKDGILHLMLPRAAEPKTVKIETQE